MQIADLEDELEDIPQAQQDHILYYLKDGRVRFRKRIEETHRELKKTLMHRFLDSRPRNIISLPIIYSMIVPFVLFDKCVSLYQFICFPLYRINKVSAAGISSWQVSFETS